MCAFSFLFSDQRRARVNVQLDLLCAADSAGVVFHAEPSSRCPQRVSLARLHPSHNSPVQFNTMQMWILQNNAFNSHKQQTKSEFSNERGRVERRAQFQKCRTRQMFVEAMTAYLDWITQAGSVSELARFWAPVYCVTPPVKPCVCSVS